MKAPSPSQAVKQAALLLAAFLALVPTAFMVMTSLKSDEDYALDKVGFPSSLETENFRAVLVDSPLLGWMVNSALLVVGAVLLPYAAIGLTMQFYDFRQEAARDQNSRASASSTPRNAS